MRNAAVVSLAVLGVSLAFPVCAQHSLPVAVLMPGSRGITPIDFVVRNESRIRKARIETVVTTSSSEAASVTNSALANKRKAVIVGMSRGAVDAARALTGGARSSGVVFVSGVLDRAKAVLGTPALLPRTLLIHHPHDECIYTSPDSARRFVAWAGGKASIRWVNTKGRPAQNPCGPRGAHGFFMQDGEAVAAIVGFVRSR